MIFGDTQPNVWTALPTILWVALVAIVLVVLRKSISDLVMHLVARVRAGASMKIGSVELGAIRTEQHHTPTPIGESSAAPEAANASGAVFSPEAFNLTMQRQQYYHDTRRIMIVHKLFHSSRPGQVYDVLVYLVPHSGGSLVEVASVEYFFGRYWANKIYPSYDRSHGFPILTSAYGTFLCCAQLRFNDGTKQTLYRYIDFEMGAYAPLLANDAPTEGDRPKA